MDIVSSPGQPHKSPADTVVVASTLVALAAGASPIETKKKRKKSLALCIEKKEEKEKKKQLEYSRKKERKTVTKLDHELAASPPSLAVAVVLPLAVVLITVWE